VKYARSDVSEKILGLGIESRGEGHVGLMRGPTLPNLSYLFINFSLIFPIFIFSYIFFYFK
jgi:hypothetical protein